MKLGKEPLEKDIATIRTIIAPNHVFATLTQTVLVPDATLTTIPYNNELFDTGAEYDNTTGILTTSHGGTLLVSAGVWYPSAAWGVGDVGVLRIIKNSVASYILSHYATTAAATIRLYLHGSLPIQLVEGDTVEVATRQNTGVGLTIPSGNPNYSRVAFSWLS